MNADYPTQAQVTGLRKLWKEAFADTDAFLDAFFETAFSTRRCRCIVDGREILAALYWFEVRCAERRFAYLYAVATAEQYRGRGLFSVLLADTKRILTAQGFDGILLVPENDSLGRMYEKFGFFPCTTLRTRTAEAGVEPADFREIGPGEFARLRRMLLPAGSILQEGADLELLASQCRFWKGEKWLAVGRISGQKLVCQEFLGDETAIPGLLRALDVSCGSFRMPGDGESFAYLLPLRENCLLPGYFALALD